MKKNSTNDVLIADAILRLQAMQNILIKKGIFTSEEFKKEIETVSHTLLKSILQKAGVSGDLDKLLDDISTATDNLVIKN